MLFLVRPDRSLRWSPVEIRKPADLEAVPEEALRKLPWREPEQWTTADDVIVRLALRWGRLHPDGIAVTAWVLLEYLNGLETSELHDAARESIAKARDSIRPIMSRIEPDWDERNAALDRGVDDAMSRHVGEQADEVAELLAEREPQPELVAYWAIEGGTPPALP